jgi:hypothetical protein
MPNRLKDLQRAQTELANLGKQGWFAHDLQRGRVLALDVLGWLATEGFGMHPLTKAKILRADKTDKPSAVMDAVFAARTSVDQYLTAKGKNKTRVGKTNTTYLENLGYESAGTYADALLKQISESGKVVALPLPSADLSVLLENTIAGLVGMGKLLPWKNIPDLRRQVFTDAWYTDMQSKGLV